MIEKKRYFFIYYQWKNLTNSGYGNIGWAGQGMFVIDEVNNFIRDSDKMHSSKTGVVITNFIELNEVDYRKMFNKIKEDGEE